MRAYDGSRRAPSPSTGGSTGRGGIASADGRPCRTAGSSVAGGCPIFGAMATTSDSVHRVHPVTAALLAQRAESIQLKIADGITTFAGSMPFVYIHAAAFGLWMLVVEQSPWPTLTLIVSLEAIFLSTFVLIGQNRQAAFQQAKADH